MKLENEIALISGASRGIGKATALELGKDGAVVLTLKLRLGAADQAGAKQGLADSGEDS